MGYVLRKPGVYHSDKILDSGQKDWIKKVLENNPDFFNEIICEFRKKKINKIISNV